MGILPLGFHRPSGGRSLNLRPREKGVPLLSLNPTTPDLGSDSRFPSPRIHFEELGTCTKAEYATGEFTVPSIGIDLQTLKNE